LRRTPHRWREVQISQRQLKRRMKKKYTDNNKSNKKINIQNKQKKPDRKKEYGVWTRINQTQITQTGHRYKLSSSTNANGRRSDKNGYKIYSFLNGMRS